MIEVIAGCVELIVKSLVVKHGDNLPETSRNFFKRIGWLPREFQDELKEVLTVALTKVFDEYPVLVELNLSQTTVVPLLVPIVEDALYDVQMPDMSILQQEFDKMVKYEWEFTSIERTGEFNLTKFPKSFQRHLSNAIVETMSMPHRAIVMKLMEHNDNQTATFKELFDQIIDLLNKESQTTTPKVTLSPPIPLKDFVSRPEIFDKLKSYLLQQPTNGTRQPVATTVSLEGGGGSGKTTLATAICHDGDIRRAYTDGIFWVELGQEPKLQELMNNLHNALTPQPTSFRYLNDVQNAIRTLLATKKILLVVDNVWNGNDAKWFTDANPTGANVITTRKTDLMIGEHRLDVDEMLADEALELLTSHIQDDTFQTKFERLAKRLGYWALMLRLGNGLIRQYINRRGGTLQGAIDWLNDKLDKRGIVSLQREEGEKHYQSAGACIEISFEVFEDERQRKKVRRQYQELGIFPPGANIPFSALGGVWKVNKSRKFDVEEIVKTLDSLSLIRWNVSTNTISLHDIFREYAFIILGRDVTRTHRRLVKNYGDLHNLPDDYAWRNIRHHLIGAEQADMLRALLLDYRWLEAKLHATEPNALIADCVYLPDDKTIALVAHTIELSSHVITHHKDQFSLQLSGRLWTHKEKTDIASLWQTAMSQKTSFLWSENLPNPPLDQAGSARMHTLQHNSVVKCVAYSPDGRYLATGSLNGTVYVWDVETRTIVQTFVEHRLSVNTIAWDSSGERLATGSSDNTVRIWGVNTGDIQTLIGHTQDINSVAWDSSGERLATGSDDTTVWIWDVNTGKGQILGEHGDYVKSMSWDNTGKRLATGSSDKKVRIWDVNTGDVQILGEHEGSVYTVTWNSSGERLATASFDKTVRIWDVNTGDVQILGEHGNYVNSVAWDDTGKRLATGANDNTVRIWDANTGDVQILGRHSLGINSVSWDDTGRRLATASDDKTVGIWDPNTGDTLQTLTGHPQGINSVAWDSNGKRLATASDDKTAKIWDPNTGDTLQTLIGHSRGINSVAWDSNGKRLATASDDKTAKIWDPNTGDTLQTLTGHSGGINSVAWDSNGKRLATGSDDYTVRLWDANTGDTLRTRDFSYSVIRSVAWDSNENRLAIGSWDGIVRIWDPNTGDTRQTLTEMLSILNLAWDSNRNRLAIGSLDRAVQIWDVNTGYTRQTLTGHFQDINSVVWDRTGERLATGSNDRTARIWEARTGNCLAILHVDASVKSVAWSFDGQWLALGCADGRVIWVRVRV